MLLELAAKADQLGYGLYAEYCRIREKGRRPEALERLEAFVEEISAAPVTAQRQFADWLLTFSFEHPEELNACPPVLKKFIAGVTEGWARAEPENPKALRWSADQRALMVAARSLPPDPIAIGRYAMTVINRVDYSAHELPAVYHGDDAQSDLSDLQSVLMLLNNIRENELLESLREEALILKLKLQKES